MSKIFTKSKINSHKSLSPTSMDKSVHKIALPLYICAFFHLYDVFA